MSTSPGLLLSIWYNAYEAARRIRHARGQMDYQKKLKSIAVHTNKKDTRLNYGRISTPGAQEKIIIGGNVKLLHLRERFAEYFSDFNLLYLVSSAPTTHWEELVQWAKRRGCKLVWNQNGVAYRSWCGDYYPWFNAPLKRQLLRADYVVYQSEFCHLCADRYLSPVTGPSTILFNPVDLEHFKPAEIPLPAEPWQLLTAGTSHHFYRIKTVLDCASQLLIDGCNIFLTIAGEFRWKNGTRQVMDYLHHKRLDAHVKILPPFTQEQAPALYRSAHILIHSKYKDPCPTVPIEAMACGVPVVGSKSGGMPELVPVDCGALVEVEDNWDVDIAPDASLLTEAVKEILSKHAFYSANARRHAMAAFDKNLWLDVHAKIFTQVLSK